MSENEKLYIIETIRLEDGINFKGEYIRVNTPQTLKNLKEYWANTFRREDLIMIEMEDESMAIIQPHKIISVSYTPVTVQ